MFGNHIDLLREPPLAVPRSKFDFDRFDCELVRVSDLNWPVARAASRGSEIKI